MALKDKRRRVNSLKVSEMAASKSLKNGTPPLRVFAQSLCILLDVMPDKGTSEADKKVKKQANKIVLQERVSCN